MGSFLSLQKANIQRSRDPRGAVWFSTLGVILIVLSTVLISIERAVLGSGWMLGLGSAVLCAGVAGLVPEGRHRLIVSLRIVAFGLLVVGLALFLSFQSTEQALGFWFATEPYGRWIYAAVISLCAFFGIGRIVFGYGLPTNEASRSQVPEEGTASEETLKRIRDRGGRPPDDKGPHPGDTHPPRR